MKIKEDILELNLPTSLLVVMGTHHGIVYKIQDDEILKIDEHRVDTPVYSDNEGMFTRGGADALSFGSVLEPKKKKAQNDFSKEFVNKIKDELSKNKITEIYLFAPPEAKHLIEEDWSHKMKECIKEKFDGNFVQESPTKLLEMIYVSHISKHQKQPIGEAKEILEKFQI